LIKWQWKNIRGDANPCFQSRLSKVLGLNIEAFTSERLNTRVKKQLWEKQWVFFAKKSFEV
jgi:hypothetical protein